MMVLCSRRGEKAFEKQPCQQCRIIHAFNLPRYAALLYRRAGEFVEGDSYLRGEHDTVHVLHASGEHAVCMTPFR